MATSDIIIRIRSDERGFSTELTTAQLNRLSQQAAQTNNRLRESNNVLQSFGDAMKNTALYGGASLALMGLAQIPAKVIEAGNAMQGLDASYLATFKSQTLANQQLAYTRDLADKLGLEYVALAQDYGKWAAATETTNLKGAEQKKIFEAVAGAAKVLNLSADDTSGTLRALSQMVSKGKVSAEELRGQLGERLPGAFKMAADAMGVSTAALDKMLQEGKVLAEDLLPKLAVQLNKTYGGTALDKASQNFASSSARLQNALTDLANNGFTKLEPLLSGTVQGLTVVAQHQDALIASSGLLATLLVGRGVAALSGYTAAKLSAASASRVQAVAVQQAAVATAQAASVETAAQLNKAQARVVDTAATARQMTVIREAIALDLVAARGTDAYAATVARLSTARVAEARAAQVAATARAEYTAATTTNALALNALTTAQTRAAAATGVLATAWRGLSAVMGLMGGPIGVLVTVLGAAAYYISQQNEELEKSKTSIKLANGEWLTANQITERSIALNKEYVTASKERQTEIRKETTEIKKLTEQEIAEWAAKLGAAQAGLAKAKQQFASQPLYSVDGEEIGSLESQNVVLKAYEREIATITTHINELNHSLKAARGEITETGEAHANTTTKVEANTDAVKRAIERAKQHEDALKGVIEQLTQQRIGLESGKLAAEYYAMRLQHLTDAEARAAAGAGQYNTYLEKRQDLMRRQAELSGSVRAKILADFQQSGLLTNNVDYAKVKPIADRDVAHAEQYAKAIDAANEYEKALAKLGSTAESSGKAIKIALTHAAAAPRSPLVKGVDTTAPFLPMIKQAAQQTGLDIALIRAVIRQETGDIHNPSPSHMATVGSPKGAVGVMQLMEGTARGLGLSSNERYDAEKNILAGSRYLAQMLKQFSGNLPLALAAYNAGPGAVKKYHNTVPPYAETQKYVRNILGFYQAFQQTSASTVPSVQAVSTGIQQSAQAAGQLKQNTQQAATSAAANVPYWETLGTQTEAAALKALKYGGVIDDTRVSQAELNDLLQGELQYATDALIKPAREKADQATKTGYAYRQQQIEAMKLGDTLQNIALTEESRADYLQEQATLMQQLAAVRQPGMAADYARALRPKILDPSQIEGLTNLKMQAEYESQLQQQARQREEIILTAEAYRRLGLVRDGYMQTQVNTVVAGEAEVNYLKTQLELRRQLVAVKNPGLSQDFQRSLIDTIMNPAQKSELTQLKMQVEYETQLQQQARQREELTLTAEAYRRLSLERDGYSQTQIKGLMVGEAEIRRLTEVKQLGESIAGVFQSEITAAMQTMLHTGNRILDALIDKLLESILTSYSMKQLFDSFGKGVGGFLSGLLPFKQGASFASIKGYAQGDAFHNAVLQSPTLFRAKQSLAVAGEAGAEAIMPMPNGGIIAQLVTPHGKLQEMTLPLTRVNGNLAARVDMNTLPVQAFAQGGSFADFPKFPSAINRTPLPALNSSPPKITVNISNHGQPVKAAESRVSQAADGGLQIDILLEQIEGRQAQNLRYGNGSLDAALRDTYGLRRLGG